MNKQYLVAACGVAIDYISIGLAYVQGIENNVWKLGH